MIAFIIALCILGWWLIGLMLTIIASKIENSHIFVKDIPEMLLFTLLGPLVFCLVITVIWGRITKRYGQRMII